MSQENHPFAEDSDILVQLYKRAARQGFFVHEFVGRKFLARVGDLAVLNTLGVRSPYDLDTQTLLAITALGMGETREEAVKQAMEAWSASTSPDNLSTS